MALKIPIPASKPGAAILPPPKIAPLWERVTVLILGVFSFPLAIVVLGFVLGALWRLFVWAFDLGAWAFHWVARLVS